MCKATTKAKNIRKINIFREQPFSIIFPFVTNLRLEENDWWAEKLWSIESGTKKVPQDRREQEDTFDNLQQEIYDKETEYFSHNGNNNHSGHGGAHGSKSHYSGNIIKGFDTFSKSHHSHADSAFNNNDRIFSLSSATYVKQQHGQSQND